MKSLTHAYKYILDELDGWLQESVIFIFIWKKILYISHA